MSRTIRLRTLRIAHPFKQGSDQDEVQHLIYTPKPLRPDSEFDLADENLGDEAFIRPMEDPEYWA